MQAGLEVGLALVIFALVLGLLVLAVIWLRQLPRNASLKAETTSTFVPPILPI